MKKKLAALLSVAMVATALPVPTVSAAYTDTAGHWAEAQIDTFSDQGILTGYNGLFRPDDSITRGEMAVILDRVMDYQVTATNTFSDLGEAFYTDAILKANASGVILGNNNTVRPTAPITRQEAAVMLSRMMGLEDESGSVSQFSDAAEISAWAVDSVGAMASLGYLRGSNGQFRPTDSITRAEVVTILSRMVTQIATAGETVNNDVNGNLVVQGADVTLKNMTISGDLILAEGIGDGDVTLDNVTIEGQTIIRGGGEHSILMNNVRANGGIVVNKLDGRVRVVTSGNTTVTVTILESGAILVGDGFEVVEIPADQAAGQTVELQGNIGKLVNHNSNAQIKAEGTIGEVNASVPTNITGDKVTINKVTGSGDVQINDKPISSGNNSGSTGGGSTGGGSTGGGSTGGNEGESGAYSITLDTTAIRLEVGQTRQLQAKVTVPEGGSSAVDWTVADSTVASVSSTGLVTALQQGNTSVTAAIPNTAYSVSCDVTVVDADVDGGWGDATDADGFVDARFADGYPICTTENGNIVMKIRIPTASESNPVHVYGVVNIDNSRWDSDVTSVIHGHAGTDDDTIFVEKAVFTTVTSDAEVVLPTGVPVTGYQDIKVHFVLEDSTGRSSDVTTVLYSKTLASEVSTLKPTLISAYINENRDAIYLHFDHVLNATGAPAAAAFTLSGVAGAAVDAVSVPTSGGNGNNLYYVKLAVSGISVGSDISNLTISYDPNQAGDYPLQDTSTTPNLVWNFSNEQIQDAAISLVPENVHISADGEYIYIKTTNSCYWPSGTRDFQISVTAGGQSVAYTERNRGYAHDGRMEEIWLIRSEGAAPSAGPLTITLTPGENTITYAMDPVTAAISVVQSPTASPATITAATYNTETQRLSLAVSGQTNYSVPYACNIQILDSNGGLVAIARGRMLRNNSMNQFYIMADQLPVLPQPGMQLRYQVLHSDPDSYGIISELSGKPLESVTLPITFEN